MSAPATAQVRADRFGAAAPPSAPAAVAPAASATVAPADLVGFAVAPAERPAAFTTSRPTDPVPTAPVPHMMAGGLFTGAGGGLVGLLAGLGAGSLWGPDGLEGLGWAGYGVASGCALAAPIGVHAANHGQGSLPLGLIAGGGVAAIAVTGLRNDVQTGMAVLASLAGSTAVAVVVERVTAR
ncbi:MAG: hypothetical protein GWN02_23365 [Gemmatimonadetes bacterium]|nr:hypothetical protein [Gemmatimonadota bacterium]